MSLSTHVLDTTRGKPAAGVPVSVETWKGGVWAPFASGTTSPDGRERFAESFDAGRYRITFDTAIYFADLGVIGFYPYVAIVFEITSANEHYHVPLLISPYGYSTYRGS